MNVKSKYDARYNEEVGRANPEALFITQRLSTKNDENK